MTVNDSQMFWWVVEFSLLFRCGLIMFCWISDKWQLACWGWRVWSHLKRHSTAEDVCLTCNSTFIAHFIDFERLHRSVFGPVVFQLKLPAFVQCTAEVGFPLGRVGFIFTFLVFTSLHGPCLAHTHTLFVSFQNTVAFSLDIKQQSNHDWHTHNNQFNKIEHFV